MAAQSEDNELLKSDETTAMRRRTLVGPWKCNDEFNKVYKWIYGEGNDLSTHILADTELDVWMNRRGYLCPAGITATKAILDAIIKDRKEMYCANDIKIFYGFAITRFVNHMLSTQLNQNMRSMYEVAKEIGLWTLVIDVRHVCSHEIVLPELKMLREVADYCLEWLNEHYWFPLKDTMLELKGKLKRTHDKLNCGKALNALYTIYDSVFECTLRGANNLKESKRYLHKRKETLALINDYAKKINSKDLRKILNAVVSELNCIGQREMLSDGFVAANCEAFLAMSNFFALTRYYKVEQNLETIVAITQGLFRYLANYGILRPIFKRLINIAEKNGQEEAICAHASFWANLILNGFIAYFKCQKMYQEELCKNAKLKLIDFSIINTGVLPNRIKKFLLYSSVDLDCTLIFGNSKYYPKQFLFSHEYGSERLRNINSHTTPLLLGLLNLFDPELEEGKRKQLKSLMNVLMGKSLNKEETLPDDYVLKTVKDLYSTSNAQGKLKRSKRKQMKFNGSGSENTTQQEIDDDQLATANISIDNHLESSTNTKSNTKRNANAVGPSSAQTSAAFTQCEFDWSESALGRLPYE